MEIYGKIWGNTRCVFDNPIVSVHRIEINKGSRCSKHYHQHKHNMFYIEKGKLQISVYQKSYDLVDITILEDNQSSTVSPGLYHEFLALEDTVAYEIYFISLDHNDIVRENCGSKEKL